MDVLIPTYQRPGALAVTLAGLAAQSTPMRIVIADQSPSPADRAPEVQTMIRHLRNTGTCVEVHHRPQRRGVAEQRNFLLGQARTRLVVYLDDDIWLQAWSLRLMVTQLKRLGCGFVGMAPVALSHSADVRTNEWATFETLQHVLPEDVRPYTPAWQRYELHNAANPLHLAQRSGASPESPVLYRVAWIGGCVMYDRQALEQAGGFAFWEELPSVHAGEDVVTQLRVQRLFGGVGVLPSGAIHLEMPTTVPDRSHQAYDLVDLDSDRPQGLGGRVAGTRAVNHGHAATEGATTSTTPALGP